jgi:hypothetical protein
MAVSTVALIASGLAYEITLPLFLLVLAFVAYVGCKGGGPRRSARCRRATVLIALNLIALVATLSFKAEQSVRIGVSQSYADYLRDLVLGTARVDLGVYGVGLPYVLAWIVRHAPDAAVLLLGALVASGVATYLVRVHGSELSNARLPATRYIAGGLVAMSLGYAVFVVPTELSFSSASLGNRIRIAASLGTAALLVGVMLLVASFARSARMRTAVAAGSVGVVCGAGFIITNTLARYWLSAWEEQREIVGHLQEDLPRLAHGSVVILDGVCLERGGAYIFTGHRDVSGVLTTRYGESLRGSAITKPPTITERGLSVHTFGAPEFFPYGKRLIVYDATARRSFRLVDRKQAERYFTRSEFRPEDDCLPGFGWRGEAPPLS